MSMTADEPTLWSEPSYWDDPSGLGLLGSLLREPLEVARSCHEPSNLRPLARTALLIIVIGGAAFGAAVGSYRGGWQTGFAALKIPLATLATLVVCVPAFYALAASFGRIWPMRTVIALLLAAGARCALVLLALAPIVWLAIDLGASYHASKLLAALAYSLAGLSALLLTLRALGPQPGRPAAAVCGRAGFLLVGGQCAWLLRPYLGDPADRVVPFIAIGAEGGGVAGALWRASRRVLKR